MPSGAGEGGSPQIEAVFWDIGFLAWRITGSARFVGFVSVYVVYVSYVLYVSRADVRRGGAREPGEGRSPSPGAFR